MEDLTCHSPRSSRIINLWCKLLMNRFGREDHRSLILTDRQWEIKHKTSYQLPSNFSAITDCWLFMNRLVPTSSNTYLKQNKIMKIDSLCQKYVVYGNCTDSVAESVDVKPVLAVKFENRTVRVWLLFHISGYL